jgi:hypothetical protein
LLFDVRDTGRPGASGDPSGRTGSAAGGFTAAGVDGALVDTTGAGGLGDGASFWKNRTATVRTRPIPTRRPHFASVGIDRLSEVTSRGVRLPQLFRSSGIASAGAPRLE